ncbi:MAG: HAD hydrolase-like protein [Chitinivibrionales bacterium]|nr:HAD hydrolase-like protein [Chitinivibrionales bacterium]
MHRGIAFFIFYSEPVLHSIRLGRLISCKHYPIRKELPVSIVAEFARQLHEKESPDSLPPLEPAVYPGKTTKLFDIQAVIFDIYGTLVHYWKHSFADGDLKSASLLEAFGKTIDRFAMRDTLLKMNTEHDPETTLKDLYHGLIALNHQKAIKKGVLFPEVKIEEVWQVIVLMLRRNGYHKPGNIAGEDSDLAKCLAFFYNFHALGRGLFPDVVDALQKLKSMNIKLGIVSNAQFYSPLDLTLFIRDQSKDRYDDYLELFSPDLCVFSFEEGMSKPNQRLFRKLYNALYELHILPQQTVFVGNDLAADIQAAQQAGMNAALFTGNKHSTFMHELCDRVIPDITFDTWADFPSLVSFHESGGNGGI